MSESVVHENHSASQRSAEAPATRACETSAATPACEPSTGLSQAADSDVSPVQETVFTTHRDPFVLKEDMCRSCQKSIQKYRIACQSCFGGASYCSDVCLNQHYAAHHRECFENKTAVQRLPKHLPDCRVAQTSQRYGFHKLLAFLVKSVPRDVVTSHVFLVRLPYNTTQMMPETYPIRKIARADVCRDMNTSKLFGKVYRYYVNHLKMVMGDGVQYLYVFPYAPDLSMAFMYALPYGTCDADEQCIEMSVELITCPCNIHSAN
jgi:hypothetical protein